jgi:hypothetical protein
MGVVLLIPDGVVGAARRLIARVQRRWRVAREPLVADGAALVGGDR